MEITKWQYCAIKSDAGTKYFDAKGEHTFNKFEGEDKDFHKLIAQLGLEGWELIGLSPLPDGSAWVYYFKKSC